MAGLQLYCRIATPFTKSGELDEAALRIWLQRFINAGIGVYLGSAGGGESHALSWDELRRIYEIGLEECKGKIPVHANPPEQYTVKATRDYVLQAIETGVDMVSIYAFTGKHGMKPTDKELNLYLDEVLDGIDFPISLAVNPPIQGHTPKPALIAAACNRHPQVAALNLSHSTDAYYLQVQDGLRREVPSYVHFPASLNKLTLGAKGIFGTEANILPKTQKAYLDAFEARDFAALARTYADVMHFAVYTAPWYPSVARWIKMTMRLFKLPGWEGGLREPYRMPDEAEYQRFADGLLRLGIAELEEQARAAGVPLPV
jgi:4-hydroxy-tetrahydrodipicolinate synthase